MIAFQFPPMAASSGIQRTLAFARHLPALGWTPIVLSAHPRAYETRDDHHTVVPARLTVERAFALDTARHLSIAGRYPEFMARPDRWVTWWGGALIAGMGMIRRYRPRAIWSTYPIATAHLIGASLARLTGLPWLADYRDPMAQDDYPEDLRTRASFRKIEHRAIGRASCSSFASPGALRLYQRRYPLVPSERFVLIENGFDEEAFRAAESSIGSRASGNPGMCTLLHSGVVYPSERDPSQLIEAIGRLRRRDLLSSNTFRMRFRAPVHDALIRRLAIEHDVTDLVEIAPSIRYHEALREMLEADGLLILQASNCNDQVPAKLYEYARTRRPVLGLTDPAGDTARTMNSLGLDRIAPLDSASSIEVELLQFIEAIRANRASGADVTKTSRYSREGQTRILAESLDRITR